jgi:uncharacterized repeat protein (TIGR02543 family)
LAVGTSTVTVEYFHGKVNYCDVSIQLIETTFSISTSAGTGGSLSANYTKAAAGTVVTLTPSANTGYQFSSYTKSPSSLSISNNKFTMPSQNVSITANFSKRSYSITKSVNPAGSGTVTGAGTATYGDTVTLSQTPAAGYLFTGWSSSDVTVSNNKFTMPAKNVSIVANYKIGRSTAALDKSSYEVGETAALTITPQSNSFTHRYKLSFGSGMETEWIDLAAGVNTASIYLPLAWSFRMGGTSVTGGTLTLETYSGSTLFGTYTITELTLSAKDGVVPSFTVWRVDESGNAKQDGEYGRYTYTLPSGMTGVQIICGESSVSDPATSGDVLPGNRLEISPGEAVAVALQFTYGSETIRISRDAPGIRKVPKILHVEVT